LVDAERGGDALAEAIDDVAVAAITVAGLQVGVQLAKGRRREKRELDESGFAEPPGVSIAGALSS
jgi:hypothetical protein